MALNYAEQWRPELLEILIQETISSPFITDNVRWLDAKTFHFTQMSTSGYKNHNRDGGWNAGKYVQTDVPFTVNHDRDIEFLVDKANVDETNSTASAQNISRTFEQTQVGFSNSINRLENLMGGHPDVNFYIKMDEKSIKIIIWLVLEC